MARGRGAAGQSVLRGFEQNDAALDGKFQPVHPHVLKVRSWNSTIISSGCYTSRLL